MQSRYDQIVLLHVSDVHFGEILLNQKTRIISGYRCHHLSLCKALFTALSEVRKITYLGDDDPIYLTMSGDLTSLGLPFELFVGRVFFHSRIPDECGSTVDSTGLNLQSSSITMVPGNHDHWYGRWIYPFQRGYSPKLFPSFFCTTPWHKPILSTHEGFQLDLIGVDSSSGLKKNRLNLNPGAGGRISNDEFINLEQLLSQLQTTSPISTGVKHQIRSIVCHHSLRPHSFAKPLEQASVNRLLRLCSQYNIPTILTGHSHNSSPFPFKPISYLLNKTIWEIRCPTTLQAPAKLNKKMLSPGFWVHQIIKDDSSNNILWNPILFLFHDGTKKFHHGKEYKWLSFNA